MAETPVRPFGHESAAPDVRRVLRLGALVAAGLLSVTLGLYLLLRIEVMPHQARSAGIRAPIPPPPRLQAEPALDLAEFRRAEQAELSRYQWVDSAHSTARIPLARAIALYVQRQPFRPAVAPAPGGTARDRQP
jgi:hypothetical protein